MTLRTLARAGCMLACVCLAVQSRGPAAVAAQQQHKPAPDHMEHRFDPAESTKRFDDPARDAWQMPDRVIAALGLTRGQSVADIGAGTGYFSVRLAKSTAAPLVYAVDIEPAMVKYLQERAAKEALTNIVAVQATGDRTNLPAPVDAVLIVNTYHHIGSRVTYFSELKKLMKPDARLAIVDYKKGVPDGPPEEFRFLPEQIVSELAKAGFTLQTQHDFLPRQLFLVFRASAR